MLWNDKENLIFGLDIGTRTIIGIVGYQREKEFVILASQVVEHESRAMIDGQIHDVMAVVRTVQKVKNLLEEQIGFTLEKVAIAAAGRVLKTVKVNVEKRFEETQEIDDFTIKSLEIQGIQEAQEQIKQIGSAEGGEYFCVGHSVVNYYLNEYVIVNLEGQKGKQVGASILATFLPKTVVESLYTVMDRVGLKVINITLEPIAAMNTVIPPNLRLLNLALVDVGAGTSDIAITKEGSVVAYGMIPLAGDEITEKIVHTYLVDFKTAETIKQQLTTQEIIEFDDIIGISHKIASQEIQDSLKSTIERLAMEIAFKVVQLNGNKPPNAVFCVGGGSQTSHITEILASKLALPVERVAIRSSNHAVTIVDDMKKITGPESITPLGICLTAMQKRGTDFVVVKVNGKMVKLLHTKQLTIADAALAIGFDHTQIIGTRGKTLMFKLNGERIRIKGESGTPASIVCNKKPSNLETIIKNEDEITIYPSQNGKDGQAKILDLVAQAGVSKEDALIMCNGKIIDEFYEIQNGDNITIEEKTATIQQTEYIEKPSDIDSISNGQGMQASIVEQSEEQEKLMYVIVNGEVVSMPYKEDYIFVSIFDFIDFDLASPRGSIVLKLNGERAAYTDSLKDGDSLEIYWDQDKNGL